jgi:hypothetical protein
MADPLRSDAAALVEQAEQVADADPEQAAALARQALDADPQNAGAANVLGVLAYARGQLIEAAMHLDRACSSPEADDDMRANLAAVRTQIEVGVDSATVTRLAEIPSATTPAERNFICEFARELWNGRDDVFENGPLLGGTTRALALGMLANPARGPAARLHTYDWFNAGVELDVPPEAFHDLIARGLLNPSAREEMQRTKSFKAVFDDLHAGHDYSPILVSHTGALPGSPEDEQTMADLYAPEPGSTWNLLLADGLKSWYGTRFWMHRTVDAVPAGSHLLFQDYGWYSCFWLSGLIGLFDDAFRLVGHMDTTYAFELTRPLDPREVHERYPPAPDDLGADGIDELWGFRRRQAENRDDVLLSIALAIHHAGALAYIGEKERAAAMIDDLGRTHRGEPWRGWIQNARESPTYTPDGPIEL